MIAHRLETVRMAKRVFLLNDGRLEELTPTFFSGQCESVASRGLAI